MCCVSEVFLNNYLFTIVVIMNIVTFILIFKIIILILVYVLVMCNVPLHFL